MLRLGSLVLASALLAASLFGCHGETPAARAPSLAPDAPAAPPTERARVARACSAPIGTPDPYRTPAQLEARIVGRWIACEKRERDLNGYEFLRDGHWHRIHFAEGQGWFADADAPDEGVGGAWTVRGSGGALLPFEDDRSYADNFAVVTSPGRPPAYFGFETGPRRMFSLSFGNFMRWVPASP